VNERGSVIWSCGSNSLWGPVVRDVAVGWKSAEDGGVLALQVVRADTEKCLVEWGVCCIERWRKIGVDEVGLGTDTKIKRLRGGPEASQKKEPSFENQSEPRSLGTHFVVDPTKDKTNQS
jgi:hypothetical protein